MTHSATSASRAPLTSGSAGTRKRERHHVTRAHLVIILVIFLLGGFSGRFGGYGYGYGHGGIGVIGIVLIVLLVLLLMGRL
jgi:hypothetical protein